MSFPINTPMPDWGTLKDAISQTPDAAGSLVNFLMGQSRPGYEGPQTNVPLGQGTGPSPDLTSNPFIASLLGQNRPGFTNGQPNTPWEDPRDQSQNPLLASLLGQNRPGFDDQGQSIMPTIDPAAVMNVIRQTANTIQQKQTQRPTDRGAVRAGDSGQQANVVPGGPPTGFEDKAADPRLGRWTRKLSAAERRAGFNDPKATAEIVIAKNNVDPNSSAAQVFRDTFQQEATEWLKDQRLAREKAGLGGGYPPVEDLYLYLNGYLSGLLEEGPIVDYGPERKSVQLPDPKNTKKGGSR